METRPASSRRHGRDATSAQNELDRLTETFRRVGDPIEVDFRALIPGVGATERATHALHPYPAKLLRHIPALFTGWESVAAHGGVVLDPFCGSGTVLVEAALAGRNAIGIDANPLAALIAQVKTTAVDSEAVQVDLERVSKSARRARSTTHANQAALEYWFPSQTLRDLSRLARSIETVPDAPTRRFLQVSLSATARQLSFADPRVSVPVRLRPDQYKPDHWLFERTRTRLRELERGDVFATLSSVVESNLTRVASFARAAPDAVVTTLLGDSRAVPAAAVAASSGPTGLVDAIITSPPYLSAQKYIRASSLGLLLLDLVPDGKLQSLAGTSIGREHFRKADYVEQKSTGLVRADEVIDAVRSRDPLRAHLAVTYISEMDAAIRGFASVLRHGGLCVLVVGPNQLAGQAFDTPSFVEELAHRAGFTTELILVDTIRSRGLMTRRNKSAAMIAQETVLVLRSERCTRGDA